MNENTKFDLEWAKRGGVVTGTLEDGDIFFGLFLCFGQFSVDIYEFFTCSILDVDESKLRMATRAECEAAGVEYIERPVNCAEIIEAAQAVISSWDSPMWKYDVHTGVFIQRLREAINNPNKGGV